ncbi:MAG: hypothetical protein J2P40_02935 [Candidatus Dormibacteraeota bacterium]|nr:hypothetical protein [Candidatus Dormibacteraeota bacterium]MBO0760209.1 hypothetical protein [Candidatus Dormibacteraeota bacterium]
MNPQDILHLIRPGYVVGLVEILATSQLLYAAWPYRRRRYLPVVLLCALGVVLGQAWALLGLPAVQLGDANVLPAVLFAVALQPLSDRLPPSFLREPRKPRQKDGRPAEEREPDEGP